MTMLLNMTRHSPGNYTRRTVERSWLRILAIAQNHPEYMEADEQTYRGNDQQQTGNREFYDRERSMIHALDTLFTLAYEGPGYLAFITTIISTLDPESPVAMAFLSHIIDRAALPSRETMAAVSPVILNRLQMSPVRSMKRIRGVWPSLLWHPGSARKKMGRSASTPTCTCRAAYKDTPSTNALHKLNAAALWSLLAEKFAGDMCLVLFTDSVCDLLLSMLADVHEDLRVRLFSLIALEKFAFTGQVKEVILSRPMSIRTILLNIIRECETMNHQFYLLSPYSSGSALTPTAAAPGPPPLDLSSSLSRPSLMSGWRQRLENTCKNLFRRFTPEPDLADSWSQQDAKELPDSMAFKIMSPPASPISCAMSDFDHLKQRAPSVQMNLNSFDTGFIPPEGKLREEWTRYVQLAHCARWSLDNVFNDNKQVQCPWDLTHLNAIMNPFDSTTHWKMGCNGLELRNDRSHFESIRATASVKSGKWYYEALLLTNGIMQIGWATNRCRFMPEEGYGVGDDCNGFAFDTFRTAVWADGTAVYPQTSGRAQCRAGDVLGSFLDLDNGLCTFFINGCDLGLTVEFDHPARQHLSDASQAPTNDSAPHDQDENHTHPSRTPEQTTSERPSSTQSLGLYPAVSLTTHQHVLLNFGDRPWMFPPPVTVKYKGISDAERLDDAFKQRVYRSIAKNAGHKKNGTDAQSDKSNDSDYDWDGPLCTICFSEPKDVMLLPCRHTGWGVKCADALDMCPLCRAVIQGRVKADPPGPAP